MLLPLWITVPIVAIMVAGTLYYYLQRQKFIHADAATPAADVTWGYKCQWLAIRTGDAAAVASALQLREVRKADWAAGVAEAYRGSCVFVTPPAEGWVFVVGNALPDAGGSRSPNMIAPLLRSLSQTLGEVQYLATHRVVEYHAYALAKDGEVVRAFAYSGESGQVLWNEGSPVIQEQELDFGFGRTPVGDDEIDARPDEEAILSIAGKWSVDPRTFDAATLPREQGIIGRLA